MLTETQMVRRVCDRLRDEEDPLWQRYAKLFIVETIRDENHRAGSCTYNNRGRMITSPYFWYKSAPPDPRGQIGKRLLKRAYKKFRNERQPPSKQAQRRLHKKSRCFVSR